MQYSKGFQVGEMLESRHHDVVVDDVRPINYAFDLSKQPRSIVYYNDTALIVAARQGNLEEVQIIVCMTAVRKQVELINFKNKKGVSALSVAAQGGYLDVVRYLIERGAVPDEEILGIAIENERTDIVQYLVDMNIPFSEEFLFKAARNGWVEILKILACNTLPERIDVFNENGHTALHVAAAGGDLEAVKILLDCGAAINLRVPFLGAEKPIAPGYRAVDFAATRGHSDVALYLMSRGANTDGFLFYKSSAARAQDNGYLRLARAITLYNREIYFDSYSNKGADFGTANTISLPSDIIFGEYGLKIKEEESEILRSKLV